MRRMNLAMALGKFHEDPGNSRFFQPTVKNYFLLPKIPPNTLTRLLFSHELAIISTRFHHPMVLGTVMNNENI